MEEDLTEFKYYFPLQNLIKKYMWLRNLLYIFNIKRFSNYKLELYIRFYSCEIYT